MADNNHGIPSSALPPGASPDYVKQMVARAEQGGAAFDKPAQAEFAPPSAPTFKTKFGSPKAAAAAADNDLLIYNAGGTAMEIEVSQAVTMGLIKPAAGGGYEAISTVERQQAEQAHRQEEEQTQLKASEEREALRQTGDEPSRELQADIDRINAVAPPQMVDSIVREFVQEGSLDHGQFVRAARSIGLDAARAEGLVTNAYEGYRRQSDLAVSSYVPAHETDALYQWAAENHPVDHKNAVRSLVLASDAKPIRRLAALYAASKRNSTDR